jgi:hypothetical protein
VLAGWAIVPAGCAVYLRSLLAQGFGPQSQVILTPTYLTFHPPPPPFTQHNSLGGTTTTDVTDNDNEAF